MSGQLALSSNNGVVMLAIFPYDNAITSIRHSTLTEDKKALRDTIKISGGPIDDDWGSQGFKVWIMRVRIQLQKFHWSVAIECEKSGKVICFNRDDGLDI